MSIEQAPMRAGVALELSHRDYIERLLRELDCPLSEYCFANLFLFRTVHRYTVRLQPVPHVLGVSYDGVTHAMPLSRFEEAHLTALLTDASCLYPIAEPFALAACERWGLRRSYNDNDSDYLYDRRRMATLEGGVLRGKRHEAAAFVDVANPSVVPLRLDNLHCARQVLELWASQIGKDAAETDYGPCIEALTHFDVLRMHGLLVLDSRGTARGFLLAQHLGGGAAAVHFAKGDRTQAGVYPYLFSQYAAQSRAEWLNFEQDLGNPGLRRAKRALDPQRQLLKFRLYP